MAKVTIVIGDDVPDQELTISMEFDPPIPSASKESLERFMDENPFTHVAAFAAWRAIDELMHSEPTVTSFPPPIVI